MYEKMQNMVIQAETTLRSLILKNQDIVDKWTSRQLSTMDEIVTVKFATCEVVKVDVEMPKFIYKFDPDAKIKLYNSEREEIRVKVRDEFRMRVDELEANILAY